MLASIASSWQQCSVALCAVLATYRPACLTRRMPPCARATGRITAATMSIDPTIFDDSPLHFDSESRREVEAWMNS